MRKALTLAARTLEPRFPISAPKERVRGSVRHGCCESWLNVEVERPGAGVSDRAAARLLVARNMNVRSALYPSRPVLTRVGCAIGWLGAGPSGPRYKPPE